MARFLGGAFARLHGAVPLPGAERVTSLFELASQEVPPGEWGVAPPPEWAPFLGMLRWHRAEIRDLLEAL